MASGTEEQREPPSPVSVELPPRDVPLMPPPPVTVCDPLPLPPDLPSVRDAVIPLPGPPPLRDMLPPPGAEPPFGRFSPPPPPFDEPFTPA